MGYYYQSKADAINEFKTWCRNQDGELSTREEDGLGQTITKVQCTMEDNLAVNTGRDDFTLQVMPKEESVGGVPYVLKGNQDIGGRRLEAVGNELQFKERGGWDNRPIEGQPVRAPDITLKRG